METGTSEEQNNTMISTLEKPISRHPRPVRENAEPIEAKHDPARLGATLRDLAVRAHRAVRSPDARDAPDARRELDDLRSSLAALQHSLRAQSLDGLVPYVAALRREVEGPSASN